MNSVGGRKKLGNIALVIDERLSRDRRALLSRVVNVVRRYAHVELIGGEITQAQLLAKIHEQPYSLILVPWYQYLNWTKVEAHYGLTRNSGPTFAGYFSESVRPEELGLQADHLRAIFLDFANVSAHEASRLIECLIQDSRRAGMRPLLEASSTIYCENWHHGQGNGLRIDNVLALPELAKSDWARRAPAIRLIINAFWSLIYEEGPGKSELTQAINGTRSPRASFQLGCDGLSLVMRLCYAMPSWTAKDAVGYFWPDPRRPLSPSQLLLKYADFLRVHMISDSTDLEVVVGLFNSAPSQNAHGKLHALWVEPISAKLVSEPLYELPSSEMPQLKPFPQIAFLESKPRKIAAEGDNSGEAKERFIFEAAVKIRDLKRLLEESERLVKEMRAGGISTAQPLAPPDAEGLLAAFQERYFEARYQLRQFEIQLGQLEQNGAVPQEIEGLKRKMLALAERERSWINQLAVTLETYRAAKATGSG